MNSGFVSPASGVDLGNAYRVRRKRGGLNNTTSQLENCPIRERPTDESIHRNRYNRSKAPDPHIRVPRGVESRLAARKGLILGVFYPKVDVVPPRGGASSELGGVIHVAHSRCRAYRSLVDSSNGLRLLPSNRVAPGLRALLSARRRPASGGHPWPAAWHDQLPAAGHCGWLRTMTIRSLGDAPPGSLPHSYIPRLAHLLPRRASKIATSSLLAVAPRALTRILPSTTMLALLGPGWVGVL